MNAIAQEPAYRRQCFHRRKPLSQIRARQKLQQLRLDTIVDVIAEAVACGATGYTFSVHPNNLQILTALEKAERLRGLEMWPVLPYAAGYVRTVNEKGMTGLIGDMLSGLRLTDKAKVLAEQRHRRSYI